MGLETVGLEMGWVSSSSPSLALPRGLMTLTLAPFLTPVLAAAEYRARPGSWRWARFSSGGSPESPCRRYLGASWGAWWIGVRVRVRSQSPRFERAVGVRLICDA